MDSSTPLERPRTSAGRPPTSNRPKTAGRNSDRPPTAASQPVVQAVENSDSSPVLINEIRRPGTGRSSMISAAGQRPPTAAIRNTSRAGSTMPPGSRAGLPNGAEGRLSTAAVPVISGSQIRPTTQQGFIAQRPTSRLGTGLAGRQVADKTYFMGLLNTQLSALQEEIVLLTEQLNNVEFEQNKLLLYEQNAEEQAEEIKRLQGELADFNFIIDRQNTGTSDLRDLEYTVMEEQKRTEELNAAVELLFNERRNAEDACYQLETKQIDEDYETKNAYEAAKTEAKSLRNELDERQNEYDELVKEKEELDLQLANSSLKQQAMILYEQMSELEGRKQTIIAEMEAAAETPEAQREQLIEQIKKNNDEIANIEKQIEEMNNQVSFGQEELHELENEFELAAGEKNDRFRELKQKERQLDDFLSTFDVKKLEAENAVGDSQLTVVRLLRLISANCRDELANVTALDESAMEIAVQGATSANELQDLHVRLQEEMIGLNESEKRLKAEMESMRQQQTERFQTKMSMKEFGKYRDEAETRKKELEDRASELSIEVAAKQTESIKLDDQLSNMIRRLSQYPHFPKLRDLRRRIEIAEDERKSLQSQLDAKLAEVDYQQLKAQVFQLRTMYNQSLIESLGR
ncbi:Intraflagellar transport protein 74-like protein [Aphelenchoides besseyi]|nr:Intraflagellar transport protein 74-like protein [Aphelenchoides besseyi]